ncbi:MAG: hypothetical protein Q9157_001601 [Trypethelium eluteriae]
MTSPLNLTFGIELEFVLLGKAKEVTDYCPEMGELAVYNALRHCRVTNEGSPYSLSTNPLPVHDKEGNCWENEYNYSKWIITSDSSASFTQDQQALLPDDIHRAWPIELKSRVFEFHTEQNWRAEIASVLRTLHHHFNQPGSTFRILVPATCGFHVHIGNRRDSFPLGTVQHLLQLVTAHERCFDTLHSVHRIYDGMWEEYGGGEPSTACCMPPSDGFLTQAACLAFSDDYEQRYTDTKANNENKHYWPDEDKKDIDNCSDYTASSWGTCGSWEASNADPNLESCPDESTQELNRWDGEDGAGIMDSCAVDSAYTACPGLGEDGVERAPSKQVGTQENVDVDLEEFPRDEDPIATERQPLLLNEELDRLKRSISPTAWIVLIQSARTLTELGNVTGARNHCAAYSIDNLLERHGFPPSATCSSPVQMRPDTISSLDEYDLGSDEPKLTIEFRQHDGSLDEREIKAWIEVVAFLTEWAHYADIEQLSRVLSAAQMMDQKLDVLNLLRQLEGFWGPGGCRNLPNWVFGYYRQRRASATIEREFEQAISRIDPSSPFYNVVRRTEESRRELRLYASILKKIENKMEIGRYGDLLNLDITVRELWKKG